MELSRKEEYRNKKVSIGVTVFSFFVMLAFFVFTNIITANSSTPALEQEVELAMDNGNSNGTAPGKHETKAAGSKQETIEDQKQGTFPEGEIIPVENSTSSPAIPETENTLKEPPGLSGNESGNPGLGYDLGERNIVKAPAFSNDTQEEGKVIVEIVVDGNGNVIEASPNGRGTTTSSTRLKAEAKKMALATKFSQNQKLEEQRGTITIIFSFR